VLEGEVDAGRDMSRFPINISSENPEKEGGTIVCGFTSAEYSRKTFESKAAAQKREQAEGNTATVEPQARNSGKGIGGKSLLIQKKGEG